MSGHRVPDVKQVPLRTSARSPLALQALLVGVLAVVVGLSAAETYSARVVASGGSQSSLTLDALVRDYRPDLRFDSGEPWRPVSARAFLRERFPDGMHRLCTEPAARKCLFGAPRIDGPHAASWLDIQGNERDPRSYGAPASLLAGCAHAQSVRDCDLGPTSALHYHASRPTLGSGYPTDYLYLDYWAFYRFNDAEIPQVAKAALDSAAFDHEGDWEGVAVVLRTGSQPRAQWIRVASHEFVWNYLPGATLWSGRRLVVFVANGTHAGYVRACAVACRQGFERWDAAVLPERPFDGKRRWGWNGKTSVCRVRVSGCLEPLERSAVPLPLYRWPGRWGSTLRSSVSRSKIAVYSSSAGFVLGPVGAAVTYVAGAFITKSVVDKSPCGPAFQARYRAPWETVPPSSLGQGRGKHGCSAPALDTPAHACENWLGPFVAVALCDQRRLQDAIKNGTVLARPSYELTLIRGRRTQTADRIASGNGVVQATGDLLAPGDRVVVRGDVPAATQLVLRATTLEGFAEEVIPLVAVIKATNGVRVIDVGLDFTGRATFRYDRVFGAVNPTVRFDTPAPVEGLGISRVSAVDAEVSFIATGLKTAFTFADSQSNLLGRWQTVATTPGQRWASVLRIPSRAARLVVVTLGERGISSEARMVLLPP